MSDSPKHNVDRLVGEYSELVARHGPDSTEATTFKEQHADNKEFVELAQVADQLRRTHEHRSSSEAMLRSKQTLLIGTILSAVLGAGLVGWVALNQYRASQARIAASQEQMAATERARLTALAAVSTSAKVSHSLAHEKEVLDLVENLAATASREEMARWDKAWLNTWIQSAGAKENYRLAADRVEQVKELRPDWFRVYYADGVLRETPELRDPVRAQQAYEKAIELNEEGVAANSELPFPMAYNNLAMLLKKEATATEEPYNLEQLKRARELVERAIELDKEQAGEDQLWDDRLWDTRGQIYVALAEARGQDANISGFADFEPDSRARLLQLAKESYIEAEKNGATRGRRENFKKIIDGWTENYETVD